MSVFWRIILILLLWIALGYHWRIIQTEKTNANVLNTYGQILDEIQKDISRMDIRTRTIEDRLKLKQQPAPSMPRLMPKISG